ncbi:MAG: PIN-like domain-containing protein [Sulfuricella sp.]
MTKKKSKKRSASNNAAPPDSPTLFSDRCAWSHRLGEALTRLAVPFIHLDDHFAPDCPDEEWLETAGKQGWIVLTRDKNIRRKPNELRAFRDHKVLGFVLTSGDASAADTAALITTVYPKLIRKAKSANPPAMFSVTLTGAVNPIKL